MKDETYVFISDVKEKGSIGRSARHRKTHAGKGGRVRLPHDNLSKKELQKMNGECKSFRLNDPMSWKKFKSMPDDIKITYIKLIRQKFNPPNTAIAQMLGVTEISVRRELARLNLNVGQRSGRMKWDKEGFWAWVNGVDKLPTPDPERLTVTQEDIDEIEAAIPGLKLDPIDEPYVEDDLPFDIVPVEEPDPELDELRMEISLLNAQVDALQKANDALMASHENDCHAIEKWRITCIEYEEKVKILEGQMYVVRMIFGGANK